MLAALLAGQGTDYAGGGLAQAIAHAAGPLSSTSNGVLEAMLLPHTMRFNAPATPRGLTRLDDAFASSSAPSPGGDGQRAIAAVEETLWRSEVPTRLRDVGIAEDQLEDVVAHTLDDWFLTRSPRPAGADELRELLHAAW
jgi:alcohol dehydrogenase class IV